MARILGAMTAVATATGLAAGPSSTGLVPDPSTEERLRLLSGSLGQDEPILRIGLEHAHSVTVAASGPFRIVDPQSGEALWKPEFDEEIHVVAEGGPAEALPSVYRVQIGAFGSLDSAEREKRRLSELVGAPGLVRHDPDRGNWRVRLGEADDRTSLAPLMEALRGHGVQGLWIAEEPAEALSGVSLRIVDGSYDSFPTGATSIAVVPARGERVQVDGMPYRGLIELRVSPFGTVRPINWIELEQYLLGVVPAELGPEVWPELQALQAQAVAARTYAWRNRGQFGEEGFDMCATPRCQVYAGASAEHPLSDRAVRATRGEILTWEGEPIVALYTATCGGHTEDGGEIFPEHAEPYLRGVPCRAEGDAVDAMGAALHGEPVETVVDETGTDVTRDWTLLVSAGVIEGRYASRTSAPGPVDAEGLRGCTGRLAGLAGLAEPASKPGSAATLGQAAATLMRDLGWTERARVLLSQQDVPALLRDAGTAQLAVDERRALAYLAWLEAVSPFGDGRYRPEQPVTLSRLAPALVRIGESYEAFGLHSAVVSGIGRDSLRLVRGKGSIRLPLADDLRLFGLSGGKPVPVERLDLWPGDRIRYRTDPPGAIDFLELTPPVKGAADDRTAKLYAWEVRRTRRQLEVAINRRISVGRLKDLRVLRRGVSGRVVELSVEGTKGSAVVRGFDVRRLLDLRESLLVIEVQRDDNGEIEAVVFAGKGWGHGVGLCQVGAYGMALRGADYREILAHYYSDAKLGPIAVGRP